MQNKIVLITGCSSGIGKALATTLFKKGCSVTATARNLDALSDLKAAGMAVSALDVTDDNQCQKVTEEIISREGRLDILINNAGYGLMGPAVELPREELGQQFSTNVIAPVILARLAARSMKENQSGLIVNIGSVSGITTTPFSGAYCASKAAIHALSDAMRMELSPFGIRVMTVQPGAIESEFGNAAARTVARVLKTDSWYQPYKVNVEARANASQQNATPVGKFAEQLVNEILSSSPKSIVRLGNGSRLLPMMKHLLPGGILDKILIRKFGLQTDRT